MKQLSDPHNSLSLVGGLLMQGGLLSGSEAGGCCGEEVIWKRRTRQWNFACAVVRRNIENHFSEEVK